MELWYATSKHQDAVQTVLEEYDVPQLAIDKIQRLLWTPWLTDVTEKCIHVRASSIMSDYLSVYHEVECGLMTKDFTVVIYGCDTQDVCMDTVLEFVDGIPLNRLVLEYF